MTKEEQLSYFSYVNEQGITRIEQKLDDLCANIRNQTEKISVFDDTEEEVCTLKEVLEAENMFFDKIWFDRHLSLEYRIEQGIEDVNPEIWYSSFDINYLNSEEVSPIECSDGQSEILKKYTIHNVKLAADCIEWFIRTSEPYPGMEWLKTTC